MSPDSIFLQKDEGEATAALPADQDELQLVICVVGMVGEAKLAKMSRYNGNVPNW